MAKKLEAGGRLGAHPAEAVAAVDGPIAAWPEGHHGLVATLGADYRIHLSRTVLVHTAAATATATALFGATDCPAAPAPFGLVPKPACLEKFLFPYGEDELAATLYADQGFVRQCHWVTSLARSGTGPVVSAAQQANHLSSERITWPVNAGIPAPENLVCAYHIIIAISKEYATKICKTPGFCLIS